MQNYQLNEKQQQWARGVIRSYTQALAWPILSMAHWSIGDLATYYMYKVHAMSCQAQCFPSTYQEKTIFVDATPQQLGFIIPTIENFAIPLRIPARYTKQKPWQPRLQFV